MKLTSDNVWKANKLLLLPITIFFTNRKSNAMFMIPFNGHTGKPGPGTLAGPYKNRKTGTLAHPSGPYINPSCCKNVLHKQHGQLGFHF